MSNDWSSKLGLAVTIVVLQTALVSSAPAYVRQARNATNDPDCPILTWESCCDLQRIMIKKATATTDSTNSTTDVRGNSNENDGGSSTDINSNSIISNTTTGNTSTNTTTGYPSGKYTLGHYGPFSATYGYCDLETDGGGWLVIFRRESMLDFRRNLTDYEDGFGELEPSMSFWYGLKSLNHITSRDVWELRVDLVRGTEMVHAVYASISIGDASEGYVLQVGSYMAGKSTASDSLHEFNGKMFYTMDSDSEKRCAWVSNGGWWFGSECGGLWGGILTSSHDHLRGWHSNAEGRAITYDRTEMKIRQVTCRT